ncbi:hypothetical protein EVG20_g4919 [Dentipellis fragilis]|uniref:Uncharacterized protein n=1 Tax=Dentipellis fragilis TaxID=205917 RepID=A0A4Y9YUY6_9AGAM|nr:hypothetical protein EVG20_g4919 [Dentipellis fragilis]
MSPDHARALTGSQLLIDIVDVNVLIMDALDLGLGTRLVAMQARALPVLELHAVNCGHVPAQRVLAPAPLFLAVRALGLPFVHVPDARHVPMTLAVLVARERVVAAGAGDLGRGGGGGGEDEERRAAFDEDATGGRRGAEVGAGVLTRISGKASGHSSQTSVSFFCYARVLQVGAFSSNGRPSSERKGRPPYLQLGDFTDEGGRLAEDSGAGLGAV